jgi:thymidylate synthase (FAD)
MVEVKLISLTQGIDGKSAEEIIGYVARVSNPKNQNNVSTMPRLLRYCINKGHWSIFETASMTIEIKCSRAIATQILRHRSFTFQEFSQRYSEIEEDQFEMVSARRQAIKNRQSSIDDLDDPLILKFNESQQKIWNICKSEYDYSLSLGISREQARYLLPLSTRTTLYMTGNIRSWIHYIELRMSEETQKEHSDIIASIKNILKIHFPNIVEALEF